MKGRFSLNVARSLVHTMAVVIVAVSVCVSAVWSALQTVVAPHKDYIACVSMAL